MCDSWTHISGSAVFSDISIHSSPLKIRNNKRIFAFKIFKKKEDPFVILEAPPSVVDTNQNDEFDEVNVMGPSLLILVKSNQSFRREQSLPSSPFFIWRSTLKNISTKMTQDWWNDYSKNIFGTP